MADMNTRPKDPHDPSRWSFSIDDADSKGLIEWAKQLKYKANKDSSAGNRLSEETQRRLRVATATRHFDGLKPEDLSKDQQVDLFNRLVELLAAT